MNLGNPADLALGDVPARLLNALSNSRSSLSIRQLARATGVSVASTQHWITHWVQRGLIDQQVAGRALMCSINQDHFLAPSLIALASARELIIQRILVELRSWDPSPLTVTAFGSFARGDGNVTSDIDLLVLRRNDLDRAQWDEQLDNSSYELTRVFGNSVQWIDYSVETWREMVTNDDPLVSTVVADGVHIFGEHLSVM